MEVIKGDARSLDYSSYNALFQRAKYMGLCIHRPQSIYTSFLRA